MNYGEVLSRAWNIIWKHKILWLFGLFASLSDGGNGGNFNFNFGRDDFRVPNQGNIPPGIQRFFENMPGWLPVLLILLALVLLVIFIVLNTFGRIGLVRGAWAADQGQDRLTFGELWGAGRRYFGRVLLLIVLLVVVSIILSLIVILPTILVAVATFGIGLLCLFPIICILGIFLWILELVTDLAIIGIVNEERETTDALQNAWRLVTSRLGEIIVFALILWLGSLVIGFVVGLPILIIVTPIIFGAIMQSDAVMGGGAIVAIILFLLYLPILLVVGAVIQSYISTTWTLVYRRLTGRAAGTVDRPVVDVSPQPSM